MPGIDWIPDNPDNLESSLAGAEEQMISVTSAEFQKAFGRYRETAQQEPVTITHHGRESLVLVSAREYRRLKQLDREALYVWELPEEDVQELAAAEAPKEAARYDHELIP
jgi:prevent-host-death family protein